MKNISIFRIIICLIALLFFGITLLIGFLCDVITTNFWINNIMMLITFCISFFATFKFKISREYVPFVIKYISCIIGYIIIMAIISLSLMFIKQLHWAIPFAMHIVAVIVFLIFVFSKTLSVNYIRNVNEKQKSDVEYLRLLENKLTYANDLCNSFDNKNMLFILIRQVQNSTTNSFPEVKETESELLDLADKLVVVDAEEQKELIKQITVLLNKRNSMISMIRR